MLAFPRRAINSPNRNPPILSPACNLSGLGEKPVASVVWRSGGVLHADPHLPACVGVAPLGLVLGLVFNHSPGSIQARWETLSVKQDSCLWWRVRVTDTAPNAPNGLIGSNGQDFLSASRGPSGYFFYAVHRGTLPLAS